MLQSVDSKNGLILSFLDPLSFPLWRGLSVVAWTVLHSYTSILDNWQLAGQMQDLSTKYLSS